MADIELDDLGKDQMQEQVEVERAEQAEEEETSFRERSDADYNNA